jgi:hypothetical protein
MASNSIRSKHQHSTLNSVSSRERTSLQGKWLSPAVIALLEYDHDTFSAAAAKKINLANDAKKLREGIEAVANIHGVIAGALLFYTVNAVV